MQDQNTGIPFNQDTISSSFGSVKPIVGPLDFINSNRRVFPGNPSDYLETLKNLQSQGATSYNPAVQSSMGLQTQPSFLQHGNTLSSQNPFPAPPLYSDVIPRSFSNYKTGNIAATQSSSLPTQFNSDILSDKKRDTTSDNSLAQSGSRQWNFLPKKNDPLSSPGPISALPRNSNPQAFSYNNNNNATTQQSSLQQSSNSDKPKVMTSKEAKKKYSGGNAIPPNARKDFDGLVEKLANEKKSALPSQEKLFATPSDSNAQAFSENKNGNIVPTKQISLQKPSSDGNVVTSDVLRSQNKNVKIPRAVTAHFNKIP